MKYGAGCWESDFGKNVDKRKYVKIRMIKGLEPNEYEDRWRTSVLMAVSRSQVCSSHYLILPCNVEDSLCSHDPGHSGQTPGEQLEQAKRADVDIPVVWSQRTLSYDWEFLFPSCNLLYNEMSLGFSTIHHKDGLWHRRGAYRKLGIHSTHCALSSPYVETLEISLVLLLLGFILPCVILFSN